MDLFRKYNIAAVILLASLSGVTNAAEKYWMGDFTSDHYPLHSCSNSSVGHEITISHFYNKAPTDANIQTEIKKIKDEAKQQALAKDFMALVSTQLSVKPEGKNMFAITFSGIPVEVMCG